ncbi:MAG: hypothetical protein IJB25_00995 [Clostridia bacterium]|nr:hypothetical protein [Clostridia bacterium]MBQ3231783.1 hypothetical protein [Clostridia bacterium]MBQ4618445.1 hypothetical protein [Clostridia bacterium]
MKVFLIFTAFFICRIFQNIFTKRTSGLVSGKTELMTFTSYQYLLCMLLSLPALLSAKFVFPTAPAIIWAVIGGIAMFSSSICCLMALRSGVLFILTTLFSSISIMIPNIASIFMFKETLSLPQWIASAALIYSAYLLLGCSKEAYKTFSLKSVLFLIGIFIAEGFTMLSSKAYAAYAPGADAAFYTSFAFGTAFVLTGLMSFFEIRKAHSSLFSIMNKKLCLCGFVLSLMLFIIMYLSTIAAGLVPAVILYSVVSGASLILSLLTARIFFKEPVTKKNIIGLIIAMAALIVINTMTV